MVVEHDKFGQRQDSLNDMFWLMTFFESASFIGGQMLANYLIDCNIRFNLRKLTYEERKANLIERLNALNAAAGADDDEDDE
ncbi:hypothetical protein CASFOL_035344 [Castilleja foliolosa]|uniref:Uncharacterized protein n=1 Tax=Castilleja foliolosa TaxID=1961234 RepID=A0ABD3BUP6_9LAMI